MVLIVNHLNIGYNKMNKLLYSLMLVSFSVSALEVEWAGLALSMNVVDEHGRAVYTHPEEKPLELNDKRLRHPNAQQYGIFLNKTPLEQIKLSDGGYLIMFFAPSGRYIIENEIVSGERVYRERVATNFFKYDKYSYRIKLADKIKGKDVCIKTWINGILHHDKCYY